MLELPYNSEKNHYEKTFFEPTGQIRHCLVTYGSEGASDAGEGLELGGAVVVGCSQKHNEAISKQEDLDCYYY